MTTKQVIKQCRQDAKKAGLTFVIQGGGLYGFKSRFSGRRVLSNMTLSTAFNDCCSGFIASWNETKFEFEGL